MTEYEFNKKEITFLYNLNQTIRKLFRNYIIFNNCRNIHYGFEKNDVKKISLFKYSIVTLAFPLKEIFNNVYINGDEFNKALKDKCLKVVFNKNELIFFNGKSTNDFIVGRKINEIEERNLKLITDKHISLQPKELIDIHILDTETIEEIIKYGHVKETLTSYIGIPIKMYLTIQLVPAIKKLNNVKIEVGKGELDTYNVNIISSDGNVTILSTHRIVNVE